MKSVYTCGSTITMKIQNVSIITKGTVRTFFVWHFFSLSIMFLGFPRLCISRCLFSLCLQFAQFLLTWSDLLIFSSLVSHLLLSRFSRVRLCATPQTAAHQAPLSLGFSRPEHWSGLPFPPPMHESEKSK